MSIAGGWLRTKEEMVGLDFRASGNPTGPPAETFVLARSKPRERSPLIGEIGGPRGACVPKECRLRGVATPGRRTFRRGLDLRRHYPVSPPNPRPWGRPRNRRPPHHPFAASARVVKCGECNVCWMR